MTPRFSTAAFIALLALGASNHAFAGTQEDSCLESWGLLNFQPRSATFGKTVESASYRSRTTVILLLASW